jgi:peptidoglycan/xylan/chitin deacetylase (PgdA/CDA1 family)
VLPLIAAGVAVAGTLGYQSMAPTGQWFGRTFCGGWRRSKQIALTFDDGPNDPHTLKLLDVLSRHEVRATFFVIGHYVRQQPNIVREIARRGHVVGNHTFSHPLLILKSNSRLRGEIVQCQEAIHDAIGKDAKLFRPPWGGRRPGVFSIVRQLGLRPVMWNVTGYDWNAPSADYVEQRVARRIRGGDVVLLHDGSHAAFGADRSNTIEATDRLLARYKSEGREFLTVPEMIAAGELKK